MKINYTITGSLTVTESDYKDSYEEDNEDKKWDNLSEVEKKDYICELEQDIGYENVMDSAAQVTSKVTLSVEL